jgi:hypothetical protein
MLFAGTSRRVKCFISSYYECLLGAATVRHTARDTSDAMWECLTQEYMSAKDADD